MNTFFEIGFLDAKGVGHVANALNFVDTINRRGDYGQSHCFTHSHSADNRW